MFARGNLADFNEGSRYGGTLESHAMTHWPEGRVLRPTFLETLLLHEPYRSALTRNGVHIHGAWFKDPLDLSFVVLAHPLLLEHSRFDQDVSLRNVRSSKVIEFEGSTFRGTLNLSSLRVEGSLLMESGQFAEVNLQSARIDSQLAVRKSRFSGKTNMQSIRVGEDLNADDAQFTDLSLWAARIDGALDLSNARVVQPVPGGGQLNMDSLHVSNSLFMRNIEVTTDLDVVLVAADIGVNLDIAGARLPSLDLTGTRVRGEFLLGGAQWRKGGETDATEHRCRCRTGPVPPERMA